MADLEHDAASSGTMWRSSLGSQETSYANFPADGSNASPNGEKATLEHVEQIHTNERVPGHTNYYEKGGLRTYGDGEDHDHEPKMTFSRAMSLVAMAFRKHLFLCLRGNSVDDEHSLDWQSNPCLPFRWNTAIHLRRLGRH